MIGRSTASVQVRVVKRVSVHATSGRTNGQCYAIARDNPNTAVERCAGGGRTAHASPAASRSASLARPACTCATTLPRSISKSAS